MLVAATVPAVNEDDPPEEATEDRPNSARLYVAGVLFVGLAAAVLVVVLSGSSGGGDGETAPAADSECISAWNGDDSAVAFGLHQFQGHGYGSVQVTRVDENGDVAGDSDGDCAVIFAKDPRQPEQEPGAGARVQVKGEWTGFESLGPITSEEIQELQGKAVAAQNATLDPQGTLVAE